MQLDHPVMQKNHHLLKPPHVQIQTTHYALGGFAVGGSFTQQGSLIVPQVFFVLFVQLDCFSTTKYRVVLNEQGSDP